MLRLVRRLLVVLLVLAVVLAGAVTWVFSGRIHSAALAVEPADLTYDDRIARLEGDRITVDDSGRDADTADHGEALRRGWTYGLRWDGGTAVVSGPAQVDGDQVTMRLVGGDRPPVGTRVDPFRDLYDEPDQVPDLDLRRVRYAAGRHGFPAYVAEPPVDPARRDPHGSGGRWAVLVHGKGGSPLETARMAAPMVAAGRTVMLIGYRNDPGAWPDPSGEHGYGTTEWRDLHAALVWAHDHGADDVVLGGVSMGGAIIASYLEHVRDHRGISRVVLDSPLLDLEDVVTWGAQGLGLPGALTWAAERLAGARYGIDWDATDYVEPDGRTGWTDLPVLVLHGDEDATVPVSLSRELADGDGDVRLEEFPGAGHVESWNSDPTRYDRLVRDWVD